MARFTHLTHKENRHNEICLLGRLKIFNFILFSYGSDINKMPSHMVEIFTLKSSSWKISAHSPNTLKKPKFDKNQKKISILILYLGYVMVKKTSSRSCPFKCVNRVLNCIFADSVSGPHGGFYAVTSMRIRIQGAKPMQIHAWGSAGQTLLCRHKKLDFYQKNVDNISYK